MLGLIKIKDYALIEECELEFGENFNVVTGESGAGKSILMSAVEFLLGGRTDRASIRTNCSRAVVTGCFTVPENLRPQISELLDGAGIPFDISSGNLDLRRVITKSATRNFINDTPAGAVLLYEAGSKLVDFHAANEHLSLTSPARQLELLDHYLGTDTLQIKCAEIFEKLKALKCEKESFSSDLPSPAEIEHLEQTVNEINTVSPQEGEDEALYAKQKIGANAREIIATANELSNMLNESENSIADQLGSVYQKLSDLGRIDDNLTAQLASECADIQDRISDLARDISTLQDKVELDPEELSAIEVRMEELFRLKRRYAPDISLILDIRDKAVSKLEKSRNAEARMREFEQKENELQEQLSQACQILALERRKNCRKFTGAVVEKLKAIGFFKSEISCSFKSREPSASGADELELMFSANPGEEPRPLRKIASSGELSRLMLALKAVLTDADEIPTVIFDEIDMNIGGETANRVGEELHKLGNHRQILCISHLAQVASKADTHFVVTKKVKNDRTFSEVRKIDDPQEEIARMLGGGDAAMEHAASMLTAAKEL